MEKNAICSITLQETLRPVPYRGQDASLPDSDQAVVYPINAFLSQTLNEEDELKLVLLCKRDDEGRTARNIKAFQAEFTALCGEKCPTPEYRIVDIPFSEEAELHAEMIRKLTAECEEGASIVCDITYGTKDLPVIVFAALAFAAQHLGCTVEQILYRQVFFRGGVPTEPVLYNMAPLLNLTSLIYTLNCDSPQSARKMLDILLSL